MSTPSQLGMDQLLDTTALAAWLDLKEQTLRNWRSTARGPRYVRIEGGNVRYRKADVEQWFRSEGWSR